MADALTADDIETALDMIDANGGTGEWEKPADAEATPRWLFPRFDGADQIGTCSDLNGDVTEGHDGQHRRYDTCGENFAPDMGNVYMSRPGIGPYDTDVETIAAWLAAPRTIVGGILLLGNPGAGKTALIEAAVCHADRTLLTHLCTPDDTVDSLTKMFVGEGNGENGTPFVKGPLAKAVEIGATFYGDEFLQLPDGVKVKFFETMDGRRFLSGGNVDGSALEIHPDFRMILSSNPLVRGASLPEPIGSRCASTTLTIETSADLLTDLGIDESLVEAWSALGEANLWRPEIRELRMADYWLNVDPAQAVSAFLPEHCPESQREQVRSMVVGLVGGSSLRADGRLVVS